MHDQIARDQGPSLIGATHERRPLAVVVVEIPRLTCILPVPPFVGFQCIIITTCCSRSAGCKLQPMVNDSTGDCLLLFEF